MSKRLTIWLSILSSVFLFCFAISFWFYSNIYNKNNFQDQVMAGIQTQESRTAISGLIIEETFRNRPVLRNVLMDQAQPVLAGVLDGPRIQNIMNNFTGRVHDSLFSPRPKAVAIDLSGIKDFVERIFAVIENITDEDRQGIRLPDQIVIIREGEIPSISAFGNFLIVTGPLMLAVSIFLAGYVLWKSSFKGIALMTVGISFFIGSLLLLLLGKWYEPVILSGIRNSYAKAVGQEIYTQFYNALATEFYMILAFGALLYIAGFYLQRREPVRKPSKS